ncbi:hypothetical protein [Algoriphagus aquimarinus]|uniref:hypothetical protein n=1 Tax=Algoriphagus aquimarinus TaxID=237018 RepID=UPI0030D9BBBD|tara:strand:+ start:1034 stop:1540 length:507 start_codon:yes stop_codon:yes gene_type:complete
MRKFRNSIIVILLLGIASALFFVNQKEKEMPEEKLIQHFREAEVINPIQGPKYDPAWFDSKYQVIAYSESVVGMSIITYDWNLYFDNNPEIEFIFYYSGKDKNKLMEWMKETGFRRPVLYDPEKVYYKNNVIGDTRSIVFNTKDGVVQFLENPSFPNYQEFLDELIEN